MNNKQIINKRTGLQNNSLHKMLQHVADTMVEYGLSMNHVFVDLTPDKDTLKTAFRDIARRKYGVTSTADLTTTQIDGVFKDFAVAISNETGEPVNWPNSIDHAEEAGFISNKNGI